MRIRIALAHDGWRLVDRKGRPDYKAPLVMPRGPILHLHPVDAGNTANADASIIWLVDDPRLK